MGVIRDAEREWDPDGGDELVGQIWDLGWDKTTDNKALNIKPRGSEELVRVWYREIASETGDAEFEEGDCVRIKYLGEKEAMRTKFEEEGPLSHEYEVDVNPADLECRI